MVIERRMMDAEYRERMEARIIDLEEKMDRVLAILDASTIGGRMLAWFISICIGLGVIWITIKGVK